MTNLTELVVPVCKGFDNLCSPPAYEYTNITVNSIAIVINVIHIFVLKRIVAKNRVEMTTASKAYSFLIQLISYVDILCAIANMVKVDCRLHRVLALRPKWVGLIVLILEDCALMYRYPLLVIACAERYFALCHAMKPVSRFFIRFLKLWCILSFLVVAALYASRALIHSAKVCIHPVVGVLANSLPSLYIFLFSVFIPLVIATVLIVLSMRELRKMRKRSQTSHDERYIRNSTMYVIIICITFYACFIPAIVSLCVKLLGKITTQYTAMVVNLVTSLYGIFNTLIYGWKHKRYREEIVNLFRSCKRKPERQPENGEHSYQNKAFMSQESRISNVVIG